MAGSRLHSRCSRTISSSWFGASSSRTLITAHPKQDLCAVNKYSEDSSLRMRICFRVARSITYTRQQIGRFESLDVRRSSREPKSEGWMPVRCREVRGGRRGQALLSLSLLPLSQGDRHGTRVQPFSPARDASVAERRGAHSRVQGAGGQALHQPVLRALRWPPAAPACRHRHGDTARRLVGRGRADQTAGAYLQRFTRELVVLRRRGSHFSGAAAAIGRASYLLGPIAPVALVGQCATARV